jgi:tetratricopeptide (TPR) repeat protein
MLCEQRDRSDAPFPVLRGLWNCYLVRGELQRVYDLADRLVVLAEKQGEPLLRALARRAQGTTLFFVGRFADAMVALDEGIAIDDAVAAWEDPAHILLYTDRAGVACRLYSAWALWFRGFPDDAVERMEAGLALSDRLAHPRSLAFARTWAAALHNFRREFDSADRRAKEAIETARKHSLSAWLGHASVCRGFALVGLGQEREAIVQLQSGLAAWNATGGRLVDTQWLGFFADAHIQAGQFDAALEALDRAAETAEATGECHYRAELYRLRGVVLAKTGDDGEAAS